MEQRDTLLNCIRNIGPKGDGCEREKVLALVSSASSVLFFEVYRLDFQIKCIIKPLNDKKKPDRWLLFFPRNFLFLILQNSAAAKNFAPFLLQLVKSCQKAATGLPSQASGKVLFEHLLRFFHTLMFQTLLFVFWSAHGWHYKVSGLFDRSSGIPMTISTISNVYCVLHCRLCFSCGPLDIHKFSYNLLSACTSFNHVKALNRRITPH